jgi:hypothetical protein
MIPPDQVGYKDGRFHVFVKGNKGGKSYDPTSFKDVIILNSPNIDYAKPTKVWGTPAKAGKKSGL